MPMLRIGSRVKGRTSSFNPLSPIGEGTIISVEKHSFDAWKGDSFKVYTVKWDGFAKTESGYLEESLTMQKEKVLILGGCGFVGLNLVEKLKSLGYAVDIYDKFTYAANDKSLVRSILGSDGFIFQDDINNIQSHDLSSYSWVINCAAESHVDNGIKDASPFIDTNITGLYNVLLKIKSYAHVKLLHLSTDEVMGDATDADNTDHINPTNLYASTKVAGENFIRAFIRMYPELKDRIVTIRFSNLFGLYQNKEKLLPTIIRKLSKGEKVSLYGDGLQDRQWTYVVDACTAIHKLMQLDSEKLNFYGEDKRWNVFNYAYDAKKESNTDVVRFVYSYMHPDADALEYTQHIEYIADRLGHDRSYSIKRSSVFDIEFGMDKVLSLDGVNFQKLIDYYIK